LHKGNRISERWLKTGAFSTPFHLGRCVMISGGLRKLSVVMAVAALLGAALFIPQQAQAQGKLSFSIATGGTGGVWYPLG